MCPSSTSSSERAAGHAEPPRRRGAPRGTDASGLVRLEARPPGARLYGAVRAWVLLLAALALVGTPVVDQLFPLRRKRLLGQEAAEDKVMRDAAEFSDGSSARLLEHDLKLRSRVRAAVARPYASFLLHGLNEIDRSCIAGPDGWLFLRSRVELGVAPGDGAAGAKAAEQAAAARRLRSNGSRLVVMPIPRKAALVPEFVPTGIRPEPSLDREVLAELRARGTEVVDVTEGMADADRLSYYLKRDTHWSDVGVEWSARRVAEELGALRPPEERLGKIVPHFRDGKIGGLYMMTNTRPWGSDLVHSDLEESGVELNGKGIPFDEPTRLAQCGTSFSARGTFGTFIAHFVGEPVQVVQQNGGQALSSLADLVARRAEDGLPDVVVEEVPNHQMLADAPGKRWSMNGRLRSMFAELPPGPSIALDSVPVEFAGGASLGAPLAVTGRRPLLMVRSGRAAHSGGATVELELELRVESGEVLLDLVTGPHGSRFVLGAGSRRLVLPIVSSEPSSDLIALYASSRGSAGPSILVVERARLVTAGAEWTRRAAVLEDPRVRGRVVMQRGSWPDPMPVQPHTTVHLTLAEGPNVWTDVELHCHGADGQGVHTFRWDRLAPGAEVLVVPGLLMGGALGHVEISATAVGGPGSGPSGPVAQASAFHVRPER